MVKNNIYNDDERLYLQMLQSNIERMAGNSANGKTWLVTIITGFLAIGCGIDALNGWILLACLPVILFWFVDGYYLSLERGMRNREIDFLNNHASDDDVEYRKRLFNFRPLKMNHDDKDKGYVKTSGQWWTISVWPFYTTIIVVILIIALVLNWTTFLSWFTPNSCCSKCVMLM